MVCQNTLTFAESQQRASANVRHSSSMQDKLRDVQVAVIQREVEAFSARAARLFDAMARAILSAEQRLTLLDKLCGEVPAKPDPRRPTRREQVQARLAAQASLDPSAGSDSAWGLYNAITWVEDKRARSADDPEVATNRMWFGGGADNKAKAFTEIAAMVDGTG